MTKKKQKKDWAIAILVLLILAGFLLPLLWILAVLQVINIGINWKKME